MTSFGESPALSPGRWGVAVELGHIPRLSDAQRRVGFNGFKNEDLNKSPVIGRLRLWLGLPAGWIAEVGYTPPLSIDGARPHDLVALAIGRRVFARGGYTLSARAFGQHGQVRGDITCPDDIAGVTDSTRNLYGCQAPSDDRIALNYYGVDLTSAWTSGIWHWHAGLGVARTELEVQVDALTYDVHDRSHLTARDTLPFFVLGTSRELGTHWSLGMEVLHVPLTVRRELDAPRERDPLTSLRLQLRYRTN
ncbi:hypothetical protein [Lysobacter sp. CFH 32150]|uniref:hypothetical protein n=1 Tax=Lysobacter sp. CFH 32150 TaxID=2927128 RepID=UPI001FA6E1D0|nr:hypothetical protein [Lysobacter sp. CFH 32150]MCI4569408.1 hypothetical protein [Lysobacter sp. CFH 32150]